MPWSRATQEPICGACLRLCGTATLAVRAAELPKPVSKQMAVPSVSSSTGTLHGQSYGTLLSLERHRGPRFRFPFMFLGFKSTKAVSKDLLLLIIFY